MSRFNRAIRFFGGTGTAANRPDPRQLSLDCGGIATYRLRDDAAWTLQGGLSRWKDMDRTDRLKRLRFRAWHRGTREADMLIGGYFDSHHAAWSEDDLAWFEALIEEQDVDIMAWAIGTAAPPARFAGAMMTALQTLDYIEHYE